MNDDLISQDDHIQPTDRLSGVGSRLRSIRESFRETQEVFASNCGVSRSYLSAIERGETKANIDLVAGIVDRYPAVSIRWLLFGIGQMVLEPFPDTHESIDTDLFRTIAARVEAFGSEIGSRTAADRCWFAAMVYSRIIRLPAGQRVPEGLDDALRLLDRILLDEEAAKVARMMEDPSRMAREGMAAALREQDAYAKAKLGSDFGRFAGQPFWPGSDLERDFIIGII